VVRLRGSAEASRFVCNSDGVTVAEKRVPHARLIVVVAALVGCAAILFMARTYTFYFDEWTFILTAPDWTVATYFTPHNEHPSLLFRVVYSLLLHSFGLHTYLPYMGLLLAAHFANVVLLFELVRRRAGDLVGIAAASLLLFLGAGWDDLLWAFQMAWLASVALGLGMLIALQGPPNPRRAALAAALLLASVNFSGVGIMFAVAAVVQLALTPGRRRQLGWFALAGVLMAAWYVAFGRFGNHPNPQPTAFNLLLDPLYVAWGLIQSAAALIGEAGWIGIVPLAAALAGIGWRWARHGVDPFGIGVAAGLLAFYAITGLTRAQLGITQSASSRYMYPAAVPWLILLADAARGLPWRGTWRPALIACVFLAAFNSTVLLLAFATARTILMERQVADYYALSAERTDPCLDPNGAVDLLVMPAETEPAAYYRAVDMFGDPREGKPLRDRASYEAGLRNLRKADC
jgi:hypothetical protein